MKPKNILVTFLALILIIIVSCTPSASTTQSASTIDQYTATPESTPEVWFSTTIVDAGSIFKIDNPGGEGYIDREIPGGGVLVNKDTRWTFFIQVDLSNGGSGNSSAGVLLVGQSLNRTEATLLLVYTGNNWFLGYRPDDAGDFTLKKELKTIQGKDESFQITLSSGGRFLEIHQGTDLVFSNSFNDPLFRSDIAVTAYAENGPHSSVSVSSLVIEQNELSDLTAYALPEPTMTPKVTSTPRWPPVFQDSGFVSEHTFFVSLAESDMIRAIAFSPDGRTFTTAGGLLVIWDVPTGIKLTAKQDRYNYHSVAYSPDGKLIAAGAGYGTTDSTVLLYDADSSALLKTMNTRGVASMSLAFSPDGKILASGETMHNIVLWDVASGNSIRTLNGHTGDVYSLAFSPDGKILASGSGDGTIILWDTTTWQPIRTLEYHIFDFIVPVYSVLFLKDGQTLASSDNSDTVFLWDVNSGEQVARLFGNDVNIPSIALSPDGRILAGVSYKGRIVLWDVESRIMLGDVASRAVLQTFETGDGAFALAFSPDGLTIASSDRSNLYLWKAIP